MDAVYPASASVLARGRRLLRRARARPDRCRTQPVTFAEIKEVDEESEVVSEGARGGERGSRRRDLAGGTGAGSRVRVLAEPDEPATTLPAPPARRVSAGDVTASPEARHPLYGTTPEK